MVKKQPLDWNQLSPATRKSYERKLIQLEASGLTIAESKKLTDNELRMRLGSKAKDISSYRRIYNQIRSTKERRQNVVQNSLKAYKSIGYQGVSLANKQRSLVKASGNTFDSISDELGKVLKLDKKYANKLTQKALKIDKSKRKQLIKNKQIRDILDFYS